MWDPWAAQGGEDGHVFELFDMPHLHTRLGVRHQAASTGGVEKWLYT